MTGAAEGPPVLCSACLLGLACRYDGRDKRSDAVIRFLQGRSVVPICPEAAAGLGVPRPAVHLEGEGAERRWVDEAGKDRTAELRHGAQIAVEAAIRFGATTAILKEGSPSCGSRRVHGLHGLQTGAGATSEALVAAGVSVLSDDALR